MLLGEVEVGVNEIFGIEAGVDVALEGQQGLLGVVGGEVRVPAAVARGVEAGELVGQVHQLGDLRGAEFAQLLDQLLGMVEELRLGEARGHRRGFVVQGLGGGNHQQHRIVSFGNATILGICACWLYLSRR
ncbi:hypothetical protein D9M71_252750 [compost metagenome]